MNQDIIVLVIVAGAVAYSVWSFMKARKRRRPASCGECTGCSCEMAKLKEECREREKYRSDSKNKPDPTIQNKYS